MNPDSPKPLREELESRLSALLLGELAAGEAALLREIIAHDAELSKLHDQLQQTISLVRETVRPEAPSSAAATEPLQLSAERRKKLQAAFLIPPLKEQDQKPNPRVRLRLVELLIVLSIVAILSAMFLPALGKAKSKAQRVTVLTNLKQLDLAKQQWAIENNQSAGATPTFDDIKPYLRRGEMPVVAGEDYVLGKVGEPTSAEINASDAKKTFGRFSANLPKAGRSDRVRLSADGQVSVVADTALSAGMPPESKAEAEQLARRTWAFAPSATDLPAESATLGDSYYRFQHKGESSAATAVQPPAPQPVQIVLPAADASSATPQNLGQESNLPMLTSTLDDSGNRRAGAAAAGDLAIAPSTGLPAAPAVSESTPTEMNEAFRRRYGGVANSTSSASAANGWSLEKLREGLKNSATPNSNRELFDFDAAKELKPPTTSAATSPAIPSRSLRGYYNDVGETPPSTETPSPSKTSNRSDVAGVSLKPEKGKTVTATYYGGGYGGGQALGTALDGADKSDATSRTRTLSDASPQVTLQGVTTVNGREKHVVSLGDLPQLGRTFTNSMAGGGNLGYEVAAAESVNLAAKERGRPEDLKGPAEPQLRQKFSVRQQLSEFSDDSNLRETSLGLKMAGEKLASLQKDSTVSATDLEQAQKQVVDLKKKADVQAGRMLARLETQATAAKSETNLIFLSGKRDAISRKLNAIRLNQGTFEGVPLGEVLRGLSNESRKLDPEKRGVNFVVNPNNPNTLNQPQFVDPATGLPVAPAGPIDVGAISVKLNRRLASAPLRDVLDEVVRSADRPIKYSIEDYAVVFSLADEDRPPVRKPSTNAPIPQPEIQTSENNFSTFSLNVSDVSFKLAAASLEKGQMPDVASIRSEEFINAFDYRDPEPLPGTPIAFAWERARYPFAVNRDLLRFSLKTAAAGRQAGRPLNIVLLLDNSGSMERADRVQIIREALRVLASQLQPQDKLSVITFARTARLVADGIAGDKASEMTEAVSGLTPQGGTNLEEAMNLAYQTAARHYLLNGINRVVLLTDGAANLGDVEPASLKQKVEAARVQGIALDCFGIGWEGFNDDLLEVLSRNGDGRYGFINSPEEAATEFAGQLAGALKVSASDVKVQVEFNPARVTSYRQIGYAKHQLTKEQFRDNTVDAAEIAAQEAGNALYTVEVNPAGSGPLGTVRVRYKIPGTTTYREQAWDVPFTGNAPALDQASPAMRLAASSAAFAEWLVASPFGGEVSPDAVLGYLRGVPEVFGADSRPKKLEWMIRQAKSFEGK